MKRRLVFLGIVAVLVTAIFAAVVPSALAGDATRIIYAQNQNDLYYYQVGATAGTFNVSLSWTKPDGTGAPVFPVAEVDGLVFGPGPDQPYEDITPYDLFEGVNPETASLPAQANGEYWFGIAPYVGDVPYHLVVMFTPSGGSASTVIDQSHTAYASDGSVVLPAAGNIRGVFQSYPGTLDRRPGSFASDVWANWDMDMRGVNDSLEFVDDASVSYAQGQPYAAPSAQPARVDIITHAIPDADVGQQVLIIPQKWGTAARPNFWNNSFTDVYPEPGTGQTYSQCPAWFLYSFPDGGDASTSRPTYTWPTLSAPLASKRSFCYLNSSTAKIIYTFYGTSLKWIYTKMATAGIANITIDGTLYTEDQYAAQTVYGASRTWTGLPLGQHTVVISQSGQKDSASSNYYVSHDGFVASQVSADDPYTAAENNYDGMTTYTWPTRTMSGTTFSYIYSSTAAVAFTFQGNSITLKYVGMATAGSQNVWVDGMPQTQVDEYSNSTDLTRSQTWTGFGLGTHTFFMMSSGTKDSDASSYYMSVAGFVDAAGHVFGSTPSGA